MSKQKIKNLMSPQKETEALEDYWAQMGIEVY